MAIEVRLLGDLNPSSFEGLRWDRLVVASNASGFMQSLSWARLKRRLGLETLHLGIFDDEQLIGGAIFFTSPDNNGAGILVAPDGPVLPWKNEEISAHCMELLLMEAKAHARRLKAAAVRIAPRLVPPVPPALVSFSPAPLHINEAKTLLVDLRQEPQQLLSAMKPKGRYNIGLAKRKGVWVYEESRTEAIFQFYSIMQQVSLRDGFALEPLSYFITLFQELAPSKMARLLFAEHEGDLLGTVLMISCGEYATYLYGGTGNSKRNLMGGYALQWEAICRAQESGLKFYDFWGFDPSCTPDNHYSGFSRFKSQFGGEPIQFIGAYDHYFVDHLADAVIKACNELSFPAALETVAT